MRPYTQGERWFPIPKLVIQTFEEKHKWFVQKEKKKSISQVLEDVEGSKGIVKHLKVSEAEEPEAPLVRSTGTVVLVVPEIAGNSRGRDLCSVGNQHFVTPSAVTGSVSIWQGSWVSVVAGITLDEESASSTVGDIEAQIRDLQKRKKAQICRNGNTKKAKKQLGPRRPRPGSGTSGSFISVKRTVKCPNDVWNSCETCNEPKLKEVPSVIEQKTVPMKGLARGARAALCPRRASFASTSSERGWTRGRRPQVGAACGPLRPVGVRRRARAGERRTHSWNNSGAGRQFCREMTAKGNILTPRGPGSRDADDAEAEGRGTCTKEIGGGRRWYSTGGKTVRAVQASL